MTTTEEHLGRFYIELQAWIDGGCKPHPTFRVEQGICGNIHKWQQHNAPRYKSEWKLWDALAKQFKRVGFGDTCYPFSRSECAPHRYANPARLAWIKEHAEAAKAAGLAVAS